MKIFLLGFAGTVLLAAIAYGVAFVLAMRNMH